MPNVQILRNRGKLGKSQAKPQHGGFFILVLFFKFFCIGLADLTQVYIELEKDTLFLALSESRM